MKSLGFPRVVREGSQGMQAVSNLPISAWLTAAARRDFPAVQIRQRKPSADW